jgi:hypothetical protein
MIRIYTIQNHDLGIIVNVFREGDDYIRYIVEARLESDMNFVLNREQHNYLTAAFAAACSMANEGELI